MHSDARAATATYLLHDAGLALREGDVPARLVLDELDLNLPALAAGLVVVVVIVVGGGARALGAAIYIADVEAAAVVVQRRRGVLVVVGDLRGHGGGGEDWRVFGGGLALTACGAVVWGEIGVFAAGRVTDAAVW
jgi:hypothetical protein